MKICVLTHVFIREAKDSLVPFMINFAKAIKKEGADVHVIAPHNKGLTKKETIEDIKITRFKYLPTKYETLAYKGTMHDQVAEKFINKLKFICFLIAFTIKSFFYVKKNKIDIIHSHWWMPAGFVGIIVSKLTKKPLIVTSHGSDIFVLNRFTKYKGLARWVFKNADMLTVVSTAIKKELINNYNVPEEKVKILPMPVDLTKFYPTEMEKKIDVLYIGRLVKRKGIDILLEALSQINYPIKTTIIGTGPMEQELKDAAKKYGVDKDVTFIDSVPHDKLIDYYNSSKIFTLPSIEDPKKEMEGLGMVLIEALLCNTPVIGTNLGGIPDTIIDNQTGLLVPEKDPIKLAEAINKLLKDEELNKKLAEQGKEYVSKKFAPEKISAGYKKIYEVLQNGFK